MTVKSLSESGGSSPAFSKGGLEGCNQFNFTNVLIFYIISFLTTFLFAQPTATDSIVNPFPVDSNAIIAEKNVAKIPIKGVLSEEELRFYESDAFPLSFLQRGRLTTTAYRGMPPGFLTFEYAGHRLRNPFSGFWNEQWLPHYQSGERYRRFGSNRESLAPLVPIHKKPVSRIIFSQDYVTRLSFVDVSLNKRLNKTDYLRLSGNNFLGNGSALSGGAFTGFKVNTYRAQLHKAFGKRWQSDFFFWHNRQSYQLELGSADSLFRGHRFKQISNHGWSTFEGKLGANDSLVFTPSFNATEDVYWLGGGEARNHRHYLGELAAKYLHKFGKTHAGFSANGAYVRVKDNHAKTTHSEMENIFNAFIDRDDASFSYLATAGIAGNSEAGSKAQFRFLAEKNWQHRFTLGAAVFQSAKTVPLLWRTINDATVTPYAHQFIEVRGVNALFRLKLTPDWWMQVEPFRNEYRDYPLFRSDSLGIGWDTENIENSGIRIHAGGALWKFRFDNNLTYNKDYQNAFAPQINNIFTIKSTLNLFANALRLDGILSWRYIGDFASVDFNRLLYAYRPGSSIDNGQYNLLDGRIQANFRDATVFFIWENILSEDYFIINDTLERLLIFRLGIDWILFN